MSDKQGEGGGEHEIVGLNISVNDFKPARALLKAEDGPAAAAAAAADLCT
jgi:hypothetical protein